MQNKVKTKKILPREKLLRFGIESLSLEELLALILRSGIRGKNVYQLAKDTADRLLEEKNTFTLIKGIGASKKSTLLAVLELGKRLFAHKQVLLILNPKDVWNRMQDIAEKNKEYFVVFFLDTRSQIIRREVISIGTINENLVHPREVFRGAILHNAFQIVISHNHPSQNAEPSQEDILTTKRLVRAGEVIGITVIDHVVVTKNSYTSLKEKHLI